MGTKPRDYDGHYVIGEAAAKKKGSDDQVKKIYDRTFGDMSKMFCTPMDLPGTELFQIDQNTPQPGPATVN